MGPELGDIGVVRVMGDLGRLIRLGQWLNGSGGADFEHAFVFVGGDRVVEAEPDGARVADLGEYAGRTVAWLRCPPGRGVAVASAALHLVGVPYSFVDYVALALRRLHVPAPGLRRYIADSGHLICSQLADRAAHLGGWDLYADGRWPGDVTPADLAALAAAHPAQGA